MDSGQDIHNSTKDIIQKYDFNFLGRFGQNFLVDGSVLEKIVEAASVTKDDVVLEVGPGTGTLTRELALRAAKVITVEIDERLITILEDTLKDFENVLILHADVMKLDIRELIDEHKDGHRVKVVSNLPYNITTPFLMKILRDSLPIDSVTLMVQKEVADRMQALPGSKDYGTLALQVQYYAEPYVAALVGPESFIPQPRVGSAVVHLKRYEDPPVTAKDPDFMFRIIRAAFQKRRKTLLNSLTNAPDLNLTREDVARAVDALGLPPAVRGETLDISQFAALSDLLEGSAIDGGNAPHDYR